MSKFNPRKESKSADEIGKLEGVSLPKHGSPKKDGEMMDKRDDISKRMNPPSENKPLPPYMNE